MLRTPLEYEKGRLSMGYKSTILVTGGAGYIGYHTVWLLEQSGCEVIILDNLVYGHKELVESVLGANSN